MTTDHQVIEHLRALNPILDDLTLDLPDTSATAFLQALEQSAVPATRRKPMSVETETRLQSPRPQPSRKRNLVIAFGAAAAVVVALAAGIAIVGSDGGGDVAAAPPLEVAEQILDAHASSGPIGMLQYFEPGFAAQVEDSQQVFQILNERIDRANSRCEETQPGRVLCRTPTTNEFHSAAGIDPDVTFTFTFNEKSQVVSLSETAAQVVKIREFNDAFTAWLLETYPDEATAAYAPTADSASAEIAKQYVGEFVAQSEEYPLPATP